MLAQGKPALIPAPPSSWDLGGSGPPGQDPWGAQMWGGKPTRHSPILKRIHNTKSILRVLLVFGGRWWSCRTSVKLERVLCSAGGAGALSFLGDTQNTWMSCHLKRSRVSSLSSSIMAMLLVLPVTVTLLHCFQIFWNIYSETGKCAWKWCSPFLLHLQVISRCGSVIMENLIIFKKQWKKPAGKVTHGESCPSPQSRQHSQGWQQDLLR